MSILTTGICLGMVQCVYAAAFNVEQWSLSALVETADNLDQQSNFTIMNPFDGDLEAQISPSFAQAHFAWAWLSESGQFNTDVSQMALDGQMDCSTTISTRIRIITSTDVILRAQTSYSYDLPPEDLSFVVQANYRDLSQANNPSVLIDLIAAESILGHVSGTRTFDHEVLLPAGRRFDITWLSRLRSTGGGSNSMGAGMGFMNLSLTATPEPATAGTLGLGALVLVRKRRNRTRSNRKHR